MRYQKAWWKSRTLRFAAAVGLIGITLDQVPGWAVVTIACCFSLLRVITDKPLSTGEVPYVGPREG